MKVWGYLMNGIRANRTSWSQGLKSPTGLFSWILISPLSASVSLIPPTATLIFPLLYPFNIFWVYISPISATLPPRNCFISVTYSKYQGQVLVGPVLIRCPILNQSTLARGGSLCTSIEDPIKNLWELGWVVLLGRQYKGVENNWIDRHKGELDSVSPWIHFPVQRKTTSLAGEKLSFESQDGLTILRQSAHFCFSLKMLMRSPS